MPSISGIPPTPRVIKLFIPSKFTAPLIIPDTESTEFIPLVVPLFPKELASEIWGAALPGSSLRCHTPEYPEVHTPDIFSVEEPTDGLPYNSLKVVLLVADNTGILTQTIISPDEGS